MQFPKISVLACILVMVNASITLITVIKNRNASGVQYSYVDRDYPLELPFVPAYDVSMTFQESVHYSLVDNDTITEKEWLTLGAFPKAIGRVWLGETNRLFVVTFYHQLHCLLAIRNELRKFDPKHRDSAHFTHCLNYLRQTFLCDADASLEEGDFLLRDYEMERSLDTFVCKDWEAAYNFMDENFLNAKSILSHKFAL